MPPHSTDDFNADRLKTLRQFFMFTQKELADAIAVSQPMITDYEAGRKEPQPIVVDALASVLKVEPEFFYQRDADIFEEPQMNFRGLRSASETLKKKVIGQANLFGIVVRALQEQVPTLPKLNMPSFPAADMRAIEESAERARLHWSLNLDGPIHSMVDVLENAGVMLTVADKSTAEKVDAFSRYGPTSVVVLNTAKDSPSRSFFDTAHECGHGVLHYRQAPKPHAQREEEAQRFASAFLMPKRAFLRDFWSKGHVEWANVLEMKHRWGTSIAAILMRAYHLGCISAAVYRAAYRDLSARGWRTDEPDEPEPEFPKLFSLALQQYEKRTRQSTADLVSELSMTTELFGKVTGTKLPRAHARNVVSLAERRNKQQSPTS